MLHREYHRRSIRLAGHDYGEAGAYFVTLCLEDRLRLFGEVRDATMTLNALGAAEDAHWRTLPTHFPRLTFDACIVMPDHLHGILILADPLRPKDPRGNLTSSMAGAEPRYSPGFRPRGTSPGSIGAIGQSFKKVTARSANAGCGTTGKALWQRGYWDRVIRDEAELGRVRDYILSNPARWARGSE